MTMKKRITLALHLLVVLYAFFSMMYWAKAQEGISYHNLRLDGGFAAQHIGTLATCDLEPCVSRRAAKAKAQLDGPATDRKSTRLNLQSQSNLVCPLLL